MKPGSYSPATSRPSATQCLALLRNTICQTMIAQPHYIHPSPAGQSQRAEGRGQGGESRNEVGLLIMLPSILPTSWHRPVSSQCC